MQFLPSVDDGIVFDSIIDPEEVGIRDEGATVVALARPVDAPAVLRHQVEECVEFDSELQ